MNNTSNDPVSGWEPEFTLDLALASGQRFQDLVDAFDKSTKRIGQLPALTLKNGWHTISPQTAEALLRRNRPGANRKASLSTVVYYATQMQAGIWPKTGQPIIFTVDGWLGDGQHRLWAAYLGLVSFDTYVVTDVPVTDNLFAYMDNGKVRNASAALQTAGLNGLSPLISQAIQMAHNFELGIYTCQKKKHSIRMAPIQVLGYLEKYPAIRKAAHLTAGEYSEAHQAIGHKDVTAFVVYKIMTLHDEEVCDRFIEQIGVADETRADNDPLRALNNFLAKQAKTAEPLAKHMILAHVIKAFNAWISGIPMKRVAIPTDDPFPQFVESVDKSQPSEEAE